MSDLIRVAALFAASVLTLAAIRCVAEMIIAAWA
jgi:hypothetical protein